MNDLEKQLVIVEDQSGDNSGKEHYWASCHFCSNEICVYESPDKAGQARAEHTMEVTYDWLFADGTWICPVCQINPKEELPMTEKSPVKQKSSAKAAIPTVASSTTDWNALLDQFAAGQGEVLFIKKRVRVRLAPFEDSSRIFIPVKNIYRGKTSTKYMVKVLYLEAPEGTSPYRALLLSKRDIRSILQLQLEGWELFDAQAGHALSLTRTGTGTDSQVSVSPSPKVLPLNDEQLAELEEFDIDAAAARYSKAQEDRANAGGNGGGSEEEAEEDYN